MAKMAGRNLRAKAYKYLRGESSVIPPIFTSLLSIARELSFSLTSHRAESSLPMHFFTRVV
jgi:hypothetical protein